MAGDPNQTTVETWRACRVGSCHRHQMCMYMPCKVPAYIASPETTGGKRVGKHGTIADYALRGAKAQMNETTIRRKPSLICDWCHHRPVMDRCSLCEECWYAYTPGVTAIVPRGPVYCDRPTFDDPAWVKGDES